MCSSTPEMVLEKCRNHSLDNAAVTCCPVESANGQKCGIRFGECKKACHKVPGTSQSACAVKGCNYVAGNKCSA